MWVNITSAKVAPTNTGKLVQLLDNDQVRAAFRKVKGFRHDYLIESSAEPGVFQSITLWDDEQAWKAFFASPEYLQIVGGLRDLFIAAPVRNDYLVRLDF